MQIVADDALLDQPQGNQDQPIHGLAISCWTLFSKLVQHDSGEASLSIRNRIPLLFRQRAEQNPILTLSDLRDDFEQFRVWAKNLGVFATDSSSLDFRLREAAEARDGIASLLRSMDIDLRECRQLIEKDRLHVSNEEPSDSSSDSDESMDSDNQLPPSTRLAAFELQARLRNISEVIDKLIRLAEVIRASGVRSRTTRAANYEHIANGVNETKLFENDYLPLVLKHRFKLKEPLLTRFCKAISLRRRRFLYQAKHQKRLAYGGGAQEDTLKESAYVIHNAPAKVPDIRASQVVRHPNAGKKQGSPTQAPTKATTFKIEQKPKAPSKIVSSSNKSVAAGVDLPPPPQSASDRATHFECPYCCVLVPKTKRETKAWRAHVVADLQPYLCIEPNCRTPDTLFESKTDWVEHQKWEHALEWWCEGDEAKHAALKFPTEDAFTKHLANSHKSRLSAEGLQSRLATAAHPSLMPFSCCPFCDFLPESLATLHLDQSQDAVFRAVTAQKQLQEHLTRELLVIFLLALPDREDVANSNSETETERALGSRSTPSVLSNDLGSPVALDLDASLSDTDFNTIISDTTDDVNVTDPSFVQENWSAVWASPQLKHSIRESYTGVAQDDVLKHIASAQDRYDRFSKARRGGLPKRPKDYSDVEIYGYDRGMPDLDVPRNNDALAISVTPPSEHDDFISWLETEFVDSSFGLGKASHEHVFAKEGYYSSPVPVKIPRRLEPLPATLLENPMNLLYFHHFLDHTARILVPHDCPENPFKTILPKMAIDDPNLLNLLLAYSACHRAHLVNYPQPTNRIAVWVRDVFPVIRQNLDNVANTEISNINLAVSVMLASLEIISPSSLGVSIPWQNHLTTAKYIVRSRGGPHSVSRNDPVMYFLTRWMAYLDVLGSLSGSDREEPLFVGNYWFSHNGRTSAKEFLLDAEDSDEEDDYTIDCFLGFTTRCVSILAQISVLARECAAERIDPETGQVNNEWRPPPDVLKRAEKLRRDLLQAREHEQKQCRYASQLSKATPDGSQPQLEQRHSYAQITDKDAEESLATNSAFHWAGMVHLLRRVYNFPPTTIDVQSAVREIIKTLATLREGGSAEAHLLFPMFTAGVEALDPLDKADVLNRMKRAERLGMCQVHRARKVMERVWETGESWETIGGNEFFG